MLEKKCEDSLSSNLFRATMMEIKSENQLDDNNEQMPIRKLQQEKTTRKSCRSIRGILSLKDCKQDEPQGQRRTSTVRNTTVSFERCCPLGQSKSSRHSLFGRLSEALPQQAKTTLEGFKSSYHRSTRQNSGIKANKASSSAANNGRKRLESSDRTVLLENDQQELYLFREEAEYSDYFSAGLTGKHTKMEGVIFYEIQVQLSQMKWCVYRRFSEFRCLREKLIKHWSKRMDQCKICRDLLETLLKDPFPSRQFHLFPSSINEETTAMRRMAMFQLFFPTILTSLRGLRQHGKIMSNSSFCEIQILLRDIEQFLGLTFTRYWRFLNERGILEGTLDLATYIPTPSPSTLSAENRSNNGTENNIKCPVLGDNTRVRSSSGTTST
jgi:hypothetical protein